MRLQDLVQACHVDKQTARRCIGLITGRVDCCTHPAVVAWAKQCAHDPRERDTTRAECVMEALNAELRGYGVEAIRGRYVDRYHQDVQACYVNTGATYNATILHDNERGRFLLTTLGDWIERYGDRRGVH